MTVLIAGGGIGGLTLALSLHQIGVPATSVRERGRAEAARRRHQRAAACGARTDRARPARPARCVGRAHQRTRVFLQARQADLERAARHRGRLQMAAILDPSRHAAADPARCRDRTAGHGEHPHQPSSHRAGPRRPTASAPNSSTRRPANRPALRRRAVDRRRRHPFRGPRKTLSAGRPADLERPHPVARHHRRATRSSPAAP